MTTEPLVSVIIPTYNQAQFLGECLDSLLAQTHARWEAIVINNYSTDDTLSVVGRYADERIRLINFKNNGIIAAARNQGLHVARGEYIAFLDSDDLWLPEKLESQCRAMRVDPKLMLCSTNGYWFGNRTKRRRIIYRTLFNKQISFRAELWSNRFVNSAVLLRRCVLDTVGYLDEDPCIAGTEDYDYWIRVLRRHERSALVLGTPLALIREHVNNISDVFHAGASTQLDKISRIYDKYADYDPSFLSRARERIRANLVRIALYRREISVARVLFMRDILFQHRIDLIVKALASWAVYGRDICILTGANVPAAVAPSLQDTPMSEPASYAIFEPWGLGDLVIALAGAAQLRTHGHKVTVICNPLWGPVVRAFYPDIEMVPFFAPWTSDTGKYDPRRYSFASLRSLHTFLSGRRVTAIIDPRGDIRGKLLLRLLTRIPVLSFPMKSFSNRYDWVNGLCSALSIPYTPQVMKRSAWDKKVVCFFGASRLNRKLPTAKSVELLRMLLESDFQVSVVLEPDQNPFITDDRIIFISGEVHKIIAVVRAAGAVISTDSGWLHVAAMSGVATIGLFGFDNAGQWAPPGCRVVLAEEYLPAEHRYKREYGDADPLRTISIQKVIDALNNLFKERTCTENCSKL